MEPKTYPLIAIRVSSEQMTDLRRRCNENRMTLADYVRAVLFPVGKKRLA